MREGNSILEVLTLRIMACVGNNRVMGKYMLMGAKSGKSSE